MKLFNKFSRFILVVLTLAAVCNSCNKGANIKIYAYPAPLPKSISPGSGYPGMDITISGSSFGTYANAVKVYFGGVEADTIRSCTDGQIVVKVPANAISGKVTLQVWTHIVDSVGAYTVIPPPVIASLSSNAGAPGDTLIVKGTGFGADLAKISVGFNGTSATLVSAVDTMLKVIVPSGFTSGAITVSINGYPVTGPAFAYLVPVPNPVYQLDFDGNLNDKMGGTAATYIQGAGAAISYVTGVNGQAVYLPGFANASGGINQTISLPAQISKYNELTVTCWVNWLGQRDQEPVFDFGETRGNRLCLVTRMPGWWNGAGSNLVSRIIFENKPVFSGYNEYNLIASQSLPLSSWHQLAMTVSASALTMKVYLDATLIGTKTLPAGATATLFNHNNVFIAAPAFGVANEPAFGGGIDKFQIFNSVLSDNELYTLYYKK